MRQRSVAPSRWLVPVTVTALSAALLVVPSAPGRAHRAAAAFPPGFWCGSGKAPAGEVVHPLVKDGVIGKGALYFTITGGKHIAGYGSAIVTIHLERLQGTSVSVTTSQWDGDFEDMIGTASAPVLVGSWDISGQVKVTSKEGVTLTHALSVHSKNWKGKLVVEKATPTVISGYWLVPKWKWVAHRLKKGTCPNVSG